MRANSAAGTSIFMLHGFYFLLYGLQGISIPCLPLWFAQCGLSSEQIGPIVTSAFLPKILSAPLFAHIADLTGKASTLIYVSLAATLILFLCYPFTHTFLALLALTLLINALIPATQNLLDRMTITGYPGCSQSYAVIRVLGSVGFAISKPTVSIGYCGYPCFCCLSAWPVCTACPLLWPAHCHRPQQRPGHVFPY